MRSVSFTFGRFNPPTIGHEKLIKKVKAVNADSFYVFPSWTQNSKKDPLPHKLKISYLKRAFSKYAKNIISDSRAKTALGALVILYEMGFEEVTMVVGSDRIRQFNALLNKYNGVDSRHGYYEFPVDIKVVSAGERDPDAEGIEGMSASKLRTAIAMAEKELFFSGLPSGLSRQDRENLYNDLSKYLTVKETHEYGTRAYRKYLQTITPNEILQDFVEPKKETSTAAEYNSRLQERPLTDNEKKKKEEVVKALKRDQPGWEKSKIYAIATATAKKWATRRKRWKDPLSDKKPRKLKRKKFSEVN